MVNFNFKKYFIAACALATVNAVSAQNGDEPLSSNLCYGSAILDFSQGLQTNEQPVAADRSIPALALGAPSDNAAGSFVSLGTNGSIVIGFEGVALAGTGIDLEIYETSFSGNDCDQPDDEFADVYLTQDVLGVDAATVDDINWISAGTICRNGEIEFDDFELGYITAVRLVNSASNTTLDGYDVDAVVAKNGCAPLSSIDQGCYGAEVLLYAVGTGNVAQNRQHADRAEGAPERDSSQGAMNFVSLGFGGTLILGFDEAAIAAPGEDDLEIVETTWGSPSCNSYTEKANLYVSQLNLAGLTEAQIEAALALDANWTFVGQSCTNGASFDVYDMTGGWSYFTMVKIKDASPVVGNRDGYDVDGIVALLGCDEIPELTLTPGDCNAVAALEYNPTASASNISVDRTNPMQATGTPERNDTQNFVALGFGGSLILGFDGIAQIGEGNDLEIVETTFDDQTFETYAESAEILVSRQILSGDDAIDDLAFVSVGTALTNGGLFDLSGLGWNYFTLVKIVDTTPQSAQFSNRDGFDVDGIVALQNECRELPSNPELDNMPEMELSQAGSSNARISLDTYPNPTTGPVTIEFTTENEQRMSVEVIDLSGRVVESLFNQDANGGQNYRVEFDTTRLPNGIYITKLTSETEVKTKKVIVSR